MIHAGVCSVFVKILKEGPMKVQAVVAWAVSELIAHYPKCQALFAQHNIVRLLVGHLAFETVDRQLHNRQIYPPINVFPSLSRLMKVRSKFFFIYDVMFLIKNLIYSMQEDSIKSSSFFQRSPALNQLNPNLQNPSQQFGQRSASGSRASSPPPKESAEMESPTESNDNSKTALVVNRNGNGNGKGKGNLQTTGRSSFSYHGDQNFPGAQTFLPVMQFAGQHPGGPGVPAVGMAFSGYVTQPNGMGNLEMTWLPVLAGAVGALGAAGALGATYCSPYITMDWSHHARPSGQTGY
ncbi:unnamed protein product [Lactuca virosa]|uniref:Uncharacterized protein n=1 Tax=Lactuca virosa TaxID=75947 RepID=A0AAU9M514_9ASTR|nr:unnamed protein product [Lactuca virosa]